MKVLIRNIGCDDTTVSLVELDTEQLEFLINIAKENNKNSDSQCQPIITLYTKFEEVKGDDYEYYEYDREDELTGWYLED